MTGLPNIPTSAIAVLNIAGIHELEDFQAWDRDDVSTLRGFGPKAFATVEAAMRDAGLRFDPVSAKRADDVNRAMADERMKDAVQVPGRPTDLPNIGGPARSAFARAGISRLADLANYTERDVLALHGVGPKAIRILKPVMADLGISFRPDGT